MGVVFIAKYPTGALVLNITELGGISLADELSMPRVEIVDEEVEAYFPPNKDISFGVSQGIPPFQYADFAVDGVPPAMISFVTSAIDNFFMRKVIHDLG